MSINIDGVEYIRADTVPTYSADKKIVVLQRGWVVVGNVTAEGDEIRVDGASVIRVWGTTRGLGELALNGPTSKTITDPAGTVRAHRLSVVLSLDVTDGVWP